mgnify:FL=1
MAIKSVTVGPGDLTFATDSQTFASQITSARVTVGVNRGDELKVLSGESIPAEATYTYELEATALQDLSANGIVDWSWKQAGKTATFVYTPNKANAATIKGTVVVDPISVGGEVGQRATSDFTFPIVGTPTFTPGK